MRSYDVGNGNWEPAQSRGWGSIPGVRAAVIQGPLFIWSPWLHATMLLVLAENDLAMQEHVFHWVIYTSLQLLLLRTLEPLELPKHCGCCHLQCCFWVLIWNLSPNPYIFFLKFLLEHLGALM